MIPMLNHLVAKDSRISEEVELRESFSLTERNPKHFSVQTIRLASYPGKLSNPKWVDEDQCEFSPTLISRSSL